MGAIENIESIFIFSYSPLNDNAIEGILNYSKTSKRKVELFDGNVLESLICKFHNINGIADFFPNTDFEKAYSVLKNKKLRIIKIIKETFDLTPNGIIKYLDLKKPIYARTTNYGHFGREEFSWEELRQI